MIFATPRFLPIVRSTALVPDLNKCTSDICLGTQTCVRIGFRSNGETDAVFLGGINVTNGCVTFGSKDGWLQIMPSNEVVAVSLNCTNVARTVPSWAYAVCCRRTEGVNAYCAQQAIVGVRNPSKWISQAMPCQDENGMHIVTLTITYSPDFVGNRGQWAIFRGE